MKMTALVLLFMFYGNISKGAPEKQQNGIVPDKQELTVLLKKSSNPNNEQQANRIRVKLWFYWEKRLQRVYQRLQRHYALRPELHQCSHESYLKIPQYLNLHKNKILQSLHY